MLSRMLALHKAPSMLLSNSCGLVVYLRALLYEYAVLFFISLLKAAKWARSRISMQWSAELVSTVLSVLLFTSFIFYLLQKMLKFLRAFWHLLLSSLIGRFAALPASLYYISTTGLWNLVQVSVLLLLQFHLMLYSCLCLEKLTKTCPPVY